MNDIQPTKWAIFRMLCQVLGGQDLQRLNICAVNGLLPQLIDTAHLHDVLPALAVQCEQQLTNTQFLDKPQSEQLKQAQLNNTLHNMQIKAQAIKLAKQLNQFNITPLFLKGTVALLESQNENIGFRKQVDIDLVVKPEDLETAGNALLSLGYYYSQLVNHSDLKPNTSLGTQAAIKLSGSHHHLPPLVKQGYGTSVELHRHFLPKRFQHKNPLEPLFSTAHLRENHGAKFLVPATEYQIIHLILGKLLNDGHLARRTMPLRESCDYIALLENVKGSFDKNLVLQHCGKYYSLFDALAAELMSYKAKTTASDQYRLDIGRDIKKRIGTMQKRYDSPALSTLLNTYARTLHLGHELAHSPAKLPAYLNRLISSG